MIRINFNFRTGRSWDKKFITVFRHACSFRYCRNHAKENYKSRDFHLTGQESLSIIDEHQHIFKILNHVGRTLEFKALNEPDLYAVTSILSQKIEEAKVFAEKHKDIKYANTKNRKVRIVKSSKILNTPDDTIGQIFHRILYPIKYIVSLTTIDVK